MEVSYLVLDTELESLFKKFGTCHPEGSKDVLKLVLKMYLKLADKSRKKGNDPLLVFQTLAERIASGRLYETVKDKINHLDLILEEKAGTAGVSIADNSPLFDELREIKNNIRALKYAGVAPGGGGGGSQLESFRPEDGAKLLTVVENAEPKKPKSYAELRKKGQNKKIDF